MKRERAEKRGKQINKRPIFLSIPLFLQIGNTVCNQISTLVTFLNLALEILLQGTRSDLVQGTC